MEKITVTLSANAGVCVDISGKRIWVDALHSKKVPTFSTVSPALFSKLLAAPTFEKPDAICYTHCHPDHFSREMTQQALERWPEAKIFLPQRQLTQQVLVEGENPEYALGDVTLRFLRLPHEGAQYADTIHYGLLILSSQGNVLVTGDCAVAAPELLQAVTGVQVDVAILDFPWLTLGKGRAELAALAPKQILLYHLPFAEDDGNGYLDSAAKAVSRWEKGNAKLLYNPLQTETL
ncbi:MAG: MBL fold metallo-hydrolase [Oscillospiraceae bacterium]|nr:MBL fold metallo-hydrolase [Oscillospiraceae bacterium]